MNKYLLFFLIVMITLVTALSLKNYLPLHVSYLMGISEYNFFPKNIAEKHKATISTVDSIITKESLGSITSQSENFDLEVYLKTIQTGIFPYLKEPDPLKKNVQFLIDDISLYIQQNLNH